MTGSAPAHAQSTLTAFASIEGMLERATQGDAAAMLELFDATAGRVLGLVSRVVGPGPVAHDVTSGCYESIWTGEERPVAGSTLPWLMEVAHRHAVTERRGVVPRQRTGAAPATQPPFPPDPAWLSMLTEDEREALSHVYLSGRTHEETDTRLGLPAGTTIQRLHEAMLHLAAEVNAEINGQIHGQIHGERETVSA